MSEANTPVHIDLNNLTAEILAECEPHQGKCNYASPCIIGALMPEDYRTTMEYQNWGIRDLVEMGVISMPEDQVSTAAMLQRAFDSKRWGELVELVNEYIGEA